MDEREENEARLFQVGGRLRYPFGRSQYFDTHAMRQHIMNQISDYRANGSGPLDIRMPARYDPLRPISNACSVEQLRSVLENTVLPEINRICEGFEYFIDREFPPFPCVNVNCGQSIKVHIPCHGDPPHQYGSIGRHHQRQILYAHVPIDCGHNGGVSISTQTPEEKEIKRQRKLLKQHRKIIKMFIRENLLPKHVIREKIVPFLY